MSLLCARIRQAHGKRCWSAVCAAFQNASLPGVRSPGGGADASRGVLSSWRGLFDMGRFGMFSISSSSSDSSGDSHRRDSGFRPGRFALTEPSGVVVGLAKQLDRSDTEGLELGRGGHVVGRELEELHFMLRGFCSTNGIGVLLGESSSTFTRGRGIKHESQLQQIRSCILEIYFTP